MEWNTKLYDEKHDFVSKYGESLIELLNPKSGEYILDIGCGTGDLAYIIKKSGANIIGLDNSKEMIEKAKEKYPKINFQVKSADNFNFDKKFDAIFSNAALHWVLEKEKTVECIYDNLKIGGRFVAEFGGKGNVENIISALRSSLKKHGYIDRATKQVWYFPSLSEYTSLLEKKGFRVTMATHYDRKTLLKTNEGIKNWIRMFAKSFLKNLDKSLVEKILNEVQEDVRKTNFKNDQWFADYVRIRVIALK